MSAEILPFDFEEQAVRVVMRDGDPWFVAANICRVLEIANTIDAVSRLDDGERDCVGITDAIGRERPTNLIEEKLTSARRSGKLFVQTPHVSVGIGVLNSCRRSKAAPNMRGFFHGRASGATERWAVPTSGNANPIRPATRDWRHGGRDNPDCRRPL